MLGKKNTKIKTLYSVFDELSREVGDEFTSAELMEAAQTLIKISQEEYVSIRHSENAGSSHYFAHNVVSAMENMGFQILCMETKLNQDSAELSEDARNKLFLLGEDTGEFN
ncbi:hypothetical protein [Billgrantia gudaonensis]|uniref:hypothetical protein n=1 Tax=Billgrantia gudaonensis TaxID=376427 RepID=UPI00115FF710|nr:hypothetical protein [Halomonas gudaonensis]